MEPVELHAEGYHLRQFRTDDLVDDRPALLEAFTDPTHRRYVNYRVDTLAEAEDYIAERAKGWAEGDRCTWVVAERPNGPLLGEVGLKDVDLELSFAAVALWLHPAARGRGAGVAAVRAATDFGFHRLGLEEIGYLHEEDNEKSAAVAHRSGFVFSDRDFSVETGLPLLRWFREAPN